MKKDGRPFGAHMSASGGVSESIVRGHTIGCKVIQLFTKNNNQWNSKPISPEEVDRFQSNVEKTGVSPISSHAGYLINLATPKPENYKKSLDSFTDEIDRADLLEIPYLVFHPGAHLGSGEDTAIRKVAESINKVLNKRPKSKVSLVLETTAGQGSCIGHRFEHLAEIMEWVEDSPRMGVCLDTCHVYAAGYDIATSEGYKRAFREFGQIIGFDRLKLFHVNDSKSAFGSRVDRHQHLGQGSLGETAFSLLVNDRRFFKTPMVLETPKGPEMEEDVMNLGYLQSLIQKNGKKKRRK